MNEYQNVNKQVYVNNNIIQKTATSVNINNSQTLSKQQIPKSCLSMPISHESSTLNPLKNETNNVDINKKLKVSSTTQQNTSVKRAYNDATINKIIPSKKIIQDSPVLNTPTLSNTIISKPLSKSVSEISESLSKELYAQIDSVMNNNTLEDDLYDVIPSIPPSSSLDGLYSLSKHELENILDSMKIPHQDLQTIYLLVKRIRLFKTIFKNLVPETLPNPPEDILPFRLTLLDENSIPEIINAKECQLKAINKFKRKTITLPYSLSSSCIIINFGKVDKREAYVRSDLLYPIGYHSQRLFSSVQDPTKDVLYDCVIEDGGDSGPLFKVYNKDEGIDLVSKDINEIWTQLRNEVHERKATLNASKKKGCKPKLDVGDEYFGLLNKVVQNYLEMDPSTLECTHYLYTYMRDLQGNVSDITKRELQYIQDGKDFDEMKKTIVSKLISASKSKIPKTSFDILSAKYRDYVRSKHIINRLKCEEMDKRDNSWNKVNDKILHGFILKEGVDTPMNSNLTSDNMVSSPIETSINQSNQITIKSETNDISQPINQHDPYIINSDTKDINNKPIDSTSSKQDITKDINNHLHINENHNDEDVIISSLISNKNTLSTQNDQKPIKKRRGRKPNNVMTPSLLESAMKVKQLSSSLTSQSSIQAQNNELDLKHLLVCATGRNLNKKDEETNIESISSTFYNIQPTFKSASIIPESSVTEAISVWNFTVMFARVFSCSPLTFQEFELGLVCSSLIPEIEEIPTLLLRVIFLQLKSTLSLDERETIIHGWKPFLGRPLDIYTWPEFARLLFICYTWVGYGKDPMSVIRLFMEGGKRNIDALMIQDPVEEIIQKVALEAKNNEIESIIGPLEPEQRILVERCFALLKRLKFDPDIDPFLEPVDTKSCTDYLSIITHPMCLNQVEQQLMSGQYCHNGTFDKDSFYQDMNLIWNNCLTYNTSSSTLYSIANKMKSKFDSFFDLWVLNTANIHVNRGPWSEVDFYNQGCKHCIMNKKSFNSKETIDTMNNNENIHDKQSQEEQESITMDVNPQEGDLIECSICHAQFHYQCVIPPLTDKLNVPWTCGLCQGFDKQEIWKTMNSISPEESNNSNIHIHDHTNIDCTRIHPSCIGHLPLKSLYSNTCGSTYDYHHSYDSTLVSPVYFGKVYTSTNSNISKSNTTKEHSECHKMNENEHSKPTMESLLCMLKTIVSQEDMDILLNIDSLHNVEYSYKHDMDISLDTPFLPRVRKLAILLSKYSPDQLPFKTRLAILSAIVDIVKDTPEVKRYIDDSIDKYTELKKEVNREFSAAGHAVKERYSQMVLPVVTRSGKKMGRPKKKPIDWLETSSVTMSTDIARDTVDMDIDSVTKNQRNDMEDEEMMENEEILDDEDSVIKTTETKKNESQSQMNILSEDVQTHSVINKPLFSCSTVSTPTPDEEMKNDQDTNIDEDYMSNNTIDSPLKQQEEKYESILSSDIFEDNNINSKNDSVSNNEVNKKTSPTQSEESIQVKLVNRNKPWSKEELEILIKAVKDVGDGHWSKMIKKYGEQLGHRSIPAIREKWRNMKSEISVSSEMAISPSHTTTNLKSSESSSITKLNKQNQETSISKEIGASPVSAPKQRGRKRKTPLSTTLLTHNDSITSSNIQQNSSLVLPLTVGTITIISLGQLKPNPHYASKQYIYPVGFKSYKTLYIYNKTFKYACSIEDGGENGPLFVVTDPNGYKYMGSNSNALWINILYKLHSQNEDTKFMPISSIQDVQQYLQLKDIPEEDLFNPRNNNKNITIGPDFFGYSLPCVIQYLSQSPIVSSYKQFSYKRKMTNTYLPSFYVTQALMSATHPASIGYTFKSESTDKTSSIHISDACDQNSKELKKEMNLSSFISKDVTQCSPIFFSSSCKKQDETVLLCDICHLPINTLESPCVEVTLPDPSLYQNSSISHYTIPFYSLHKHNSKGECIPTILKLHEECSIIIQRVYVTQTKKNKQEELDTIERTIRYKYTSALREVSVRSQPIGEDRFDNEYYRYQGDLGRLYIYYPLHQKWSVLDSMDEIKKLLLWLNPFIFESEKRLSLRLIDMLPEIYRDMKMINCSCRIPLHPLTTNQYNNMYKKIIEQYQITHNILLLETLTHLQRPQMDITEFTIESAQSELLVIPYSALIYSKRIRTPEMNMIGPHKLQSTSYIESLYSSSSINTFQDLYNKNKESNNQDSDMSEMKTETSQTDKQILIQSNTIQDPNSKNKDLCIKNEASITENDDNKLINLPQLEDIHNLSRCPICSVYIEPYLYHCQYCHLNYKCKDIHSFNQHIEECKQSEYKKHICTYSVQTLYGQQIYNIKSKLIDLELGLPPFIMTKKSLNNWTPARRMAWRNQLCQCSTAEELFVCITILEKLISKGWLHRWFKWCIPSLQVQTNILTLSSLSIRVDALDECLRYKRSGSVLDHNDDNTQQGMTSMMENTVDMSLQEDQLRDNNMNQEEEDILMNNEEDNDFDEMFALGETLDNMNDDDDDEDEDITTMSIHNDNTIGNNKKKAKSITSSMSMSSKTKTNKTNKKLNKNSDTVNKNSSVKEISSETKLLSLPLKIQLNSKVKNQASSVHDVMNVEEEEDDDDDDDSMSYDDINNKDEDYNDIDDEMNDSEFNEDKNDLFSSDSIENESMDLSIEEDNEWNKQRKNKHISQKINSKHSPRSVMNNNKNKKLSSIQNTLLSKKSISKDKNNINKTILNISSSKNISNIHIYITTKPNYSIRSISPITFYNTIQKSIENNSNQLSTSINNINKTQNKQHSKTEMKLNIKINNNNDNNNNKSIHTQHNKLITNKKKTLNTNKNILKHHRIQQFSDSSYEDLKDLDTSDYTLQKSTNQHQLKSHKKYSENNENEFDLSDEESFSI